MKKNKPHCFKTVIKKYPYIYRGSPKYYLNMTADICNGNDKDCCLCNGCFEALKKGTGALKDFYND